MYSDILYKKYGCRTTNQIKGYLKFIKIVNLINGEYFAFDNESMKRISDNPRGLSFTFGSFTTDKDSLDLSIYKTIPFLVKSSSRFFLKPDIGEVFDQMTIEDIMQTVAIYVDSEIHQTINADGDEFLMEAVLLTNIKKIRKDKLNKINECKS